MSNDNSQTALARAIAHIAHKGQVDKAGNPYIDHPHRVAERLWQESDEIKAAAWLHDVLEDTDVTSADLSVAGISQSVIHYVERVTRNDDQTVEDYYEKIRCGPVGAFRVKLADIADNTDPSRLALLDDATIVRLTRKYAKVRLLLGVSDDPR